MGSVPHRSRAPLARSMRASWAPLGGLWVLRSDARAHTRLTKQNDNSRSSSSTTQRDEASGFGIGGTSCRYIVGSSPRWPSTVSTATCPKWAFVCRSGPRMQSLSSSSRTGCSRRAANFCHPSARTSPSMGPSPARNSTSPFASFVTGAVAYCGRPEPRGGRVVPPRGRPERPPMVRARRSPSPVA